MCNQNKKKIKFAWNILSYLGALGTQSPLLQGPPSSIWSPLLLGTPSLQVSGNPLLLGTPVENTMDFQQLSIAYIKKLWKYQIRKICFVFFLNLVSLVFPSNFGEYNEYTNHKLETGIFFFKIFSFFLNSRNQNLWRINSYICLP